MNNHAVRRYIRHLRRADPAFPHLGPEYCTCGAHNGHNE